MDDAGARPFLEKFLQERDAHCPQCDYNLRNLKTDICPECGEQIALRVALVEAKQGAPIAGLLHFRLAPGSMDCSSFTGLSRCFDAARTFWSWANSSR